MRQENVKEEKRRDHSFEVVEGAQFYKAGHKPGVIRPGSGKVCAKLSSESERAFFAHLFDVTNSESVNMIHEQNGDKQGWTWEPEDEYMLRDVWPKGLDLSRAIVYVRIPHLQCTDHASTDLYPTALRARC